jgi:multidrug efflux pump subunit AcrA (membrane-fusion protein)
VLRTQGDIAIVDGDLKAGERVVTDGQLRLRPGSKVQIKGAPAGDSAAHGGTS